MTTRTKPNSTTFPESFVSPALGAPLLSSGVLLGLDMISANLRMWRTASDAARNLIQMQQDAMLDFARGQLSGRGAEASPTGTPFDQAMATTSQAYETFGAAWLDAQRKAYESFSRADIHH